MTAKLFPEPVSSAAPKIPRGFAVYAEAGRRRTVRHLAGYAEFATMCSEAGTDPATLAVDLDSLIVFVRGRKDEIEAAGLQDAAANLLRERAGATA